MLEAAGYGIDQDRDWIADEIDWLNGAGDPSDVDRAKAPGIAGSNSGYRKSITCGVTLLSSEAPTPLLILVPLVLLAWRRRRADEPS